MKQLIVKVDETQNEDYIRGWIGEDLNSKLEATTPHGEYGGDITGLYQVGNILYECTYEPEWNRYDKRFYYIDNTYSEDEYVTMKEIGVLHCDGKESE